jgi:hypothetical protein
LSGIPLDLDLEAALHRGDGGGGIVRGIHVFIAPGHHENIQVLQGAGVQRIQHDFAARVNVVDRNGFL